MAKLLLWKPAVVNKSVPQPTGKLLEMRLPYSVEKVARPRKLYPVTIQAKAVGE